MTPPRDARGRFLPRIRHDPLHPYVLLQEDGLPAYRMGTVTEGYALAAECGADLLVTFPTGRPVRIVHFVRPTRVVL